MFGRVRRAAKAACPDAPIRAYGLLHTFNAQGLTNVVAAGMGAASVGSGAGMVTLPDGRQVSAVGEAINIMQKAGREVQRHYANLPGHVLVVVTDEDVRLWRWNTASTLGERVALWPKGSYVASWVTYGSRTGVRLVLDSGLMTILTGTEGHRDVEETLDAVMSMGKRSARWT